MKEYIEREAALACKQPIGAYGMDISSEDIKAIPAADVVEVRHGMWEGRIVDDDELDKYGFFRRRFYCSACGNWNTHGASKYCPHCGAQMDGGVNDDDN